MRRSECAVHFTHESDNIGIDAILIGIGISISIDIDILRFRSARINLRRQTDIERNWKSLYTPKNCY